MHHQTSENPHTLLPVFEPLQLGWMSYQVRGNPLTLQSLFSLVIKERGQTATLINTYRFFLKKTPQKLKKQKRKKKSYKDINKRFFPTFGLTTRIFCCTLELGVDRAKCLNIRIMQKANFYIYVFLFNVFLSLKLWFIKPCNTWVGGQGQGLYFCRSLLLTRILAGTHTNSSLKQT